MQPPHLDDCRITHLFVVELELIDDVGHQLLGGLQGVIALPVSTEEQFPHKDIMITKSWPVIK